MAETLEQTSDLETGTLSRSRSGLLIVIGIGLCAGLVSMLLPDKPPLCKAGTLPHWVFFGQQILRDLLRAVVVLAAAVVISLAVPQIGMFIERMILRCRLGSFLAVTAGLAVLSSAMFAWFTLAHMPHIQDEIAMLFQAKVLASGRLYAPAPPLIDFFDYEFIVVDGPRWYGKYFLTPSLVMVPGVWLGVPWLVSPLLGGVAVLLTYGIAANLLNDRIARVAVVLMVISPMRMSLFAMMMAHPSCMVAMGLFTLGIIKLVKRPGSIGWALAAGIGMALAVNCRPLTAVALGSVVGLIAALRFEWRQLRPLPAAALLLPMLAGAAVFLAYNHALTGSPGLTPFTKWSPNDHLGFGPEVGLEYAPEGDKGHSFSKALFRNTQFNIDAVGTHLTGWGYVTLLLLVIPLTASPWPRRALALYVAVASLAVSYFFYYTPSVIVGQARYWSESMPMMFALVAIGALAVRIRLPRLCRLLGALPAARTGRAACWLAGGLLTLLSVFGVYPALLDQCHSLWGQGPLLRDQVAAQKLQNAIVFVGADHYRRYARDLRWDHYAAAFQLNDPDLTGPVIFARDLGPRNAELIAQHPGRSLYRINLKLESQAVLEPVRPEAATRPADR